MARPPKKTVAYFPHDVRHGKTLQIIETRFGNDGYGLWFKTLEMLGDSEGHFIDCSDDLTWEYFCSRMRLSNEKCLEILTLLAKLSAIDAELWTEKRIIWSENFVARIADVYQNRTSERPVKPGFQAENRGFQAENRGFQGGNPQSKVKEIKEKKKKRKEKERIADPTHSQSVFSCESFEVSQDHLDTLVQRYPDFPAKFLVGEFFPRMADWCLDHRNDPAHAKKFDEAGHLKEPRRCLSNWLRREDPGKAAEYRRPIGPPPLPPDPPGMQTVFNPDCRICRGGGRDRDGPCSCGKLEEIVDPDPDCPKCKGDGFTRVGLCDCLKPRGGNGKGNESLDTRREAMTDQGLQEPEAMFADKVGAEAGAAGQEQGAGT